jgi:hypothetical protein
MNIARGLWASIQGDPVFMRRLNGWLTILWVVMIPVSIAMHWLSSVVYVSALSIWALVAGHWSSWQAARVECKQLEEAEDRRREPIERKVVDRLIRETELRPASGGGGRR